MLPFKLPEHFLRRAIAWVKTLPFSCSHVALLFQNKPEERLAPSSVSDFHGTSHTPSLAKLEQDVKAKHVSDWATMLKNSSMSDVTIYVRGGLAVPAHKLVLGVRCPQVLRDVTKQQSPVTGLDMDVILWPDTSNEVASCFLEYIYYGSIVSIHTLRRDTSDLRWLADRYEASDLIGVLSYFEGKKRVAKSLCERSPSPDPEPQSVSEKMSMRSLETVPVQGNLAESVSLPEDGESVDMFLDEEEKESNTNRSLPGREAEERTESRASDHSIQRGETEQRRVSRSSQDSAASRKTEEVKGGPSTRQPGTQERQGSPMSEHSIHSQKTIIPENRSPSPDIFSDEYDFDLSTSPKPKTSRDNTGTKTLFDSSLNLDADALAQIDELTCNTQAKPGSSGKQSTSPWRISVGSRNTASPQSDKSIALSEKLGSPKSPPQILESSPLSDLPMFDGTQRSSVPKRPIYPGDDNDVVIISDDDEENTNGRRKSQDNPSINDYGKATKVVPHSQKYHDVLSTSTDEEEEKTVTYSRKRRDVLAMSSDESQKTVSESRKHCDVAMSTDDEDKTAVNSRKPPDVLELSSDEEVKKSDSGTRKPQDLLSMSTESLKSRKSPSPGRNSPYISPVWNGFDDMACDFDMGQNWNDGPELETHTSPRQNGALSPIYRRDTSPVRLSPLGGRHLDTSPVRLSPVGGRQLDTSPVRLSPVGGRQLDTSPVRLSPVGGRHLDTSPVRRRTSVGHGRGFDASPARRGSLDASPVRVEGEGPKRKGVSSRGMKVHDISDSGSSDEECAQGNVAVDMLDDSMNAILASSHLDPLIERRTPKRKQRKDEGDRESGWVTPMKNYRGMTTPEIKVSQELH